MARRWSGPDVVRRVAPRTRRQRSGADSPLDSVAARRRSGRDIPRRRPRHSRGRAGTIQIRRRAARPRSRRSNPPGDNQRRQPHLAARLALSAHGQSRDYLPSPVSCSTSIKRGDSGRSKARKRATGESNRIRALDSWSPQRAGDLITFRAPGRVNLIGEHTDYNAGFVMPAAINLSAFTTITPREDRKLQIHSDNFEDEVEVDLDDTTLKARTHWSDYPVGVAVMLERAGHRVRGARLEIRSDVPMGSGLSSSAAVEVSTACALIKNSDIKIDRKDLALLCQKAENEFVGARVGIMDQFVALFGEEQRALMLDCRSLEYKLLPVTEAVRL